MLQRAPRLTTRLSTRLLPNQLQQWLVALCFGALLVTGWQLTPDFGSFIDEATCRESGQISLMYLYECVPARWLPARAAARLAVLPPHAHLAHYVDRDYGVAFELPMTLLEKASGYTTQHDVLVLRHRCVFVVCWLGCWAVYWLARRRFDSWRMGLLAVALLLLSPRIFADFFYNAKDAVFLACFAIGTATAVAFIAQPSARRAAGHALACALAIDVRIVGIVLPAATLGLLVLRRLHGDYAGTGRRIEPYAILYVVLLVVFTVFCWPWLWSAPAAHFWEALVNMSHFRWQNIMLHQGQWLPPGTQLSWSYLPLWISITTPPLYLAGLAVSFGLLLRQLGRHGWRFYGSAGEWQDLLFWILGLGPLVTVVVLHSVLYEGWRQLYFVYPSLLLLALGGLVAIWRWHPPRARLAPYWRGAVGIVVLGNLTAIAAKMVQLHPLECLYFNALAGTHPERRYEYDYWGLSLRQGLAWILAHDQRPLIRVQTNLVASDITNSYLLSLAEQRRLRIEFVPVAADYFITTHRAHPSPYPLGPPVYTLRVDDEGRRVFDIYRFAKLRTVPDLLGEQLTSTIQVEAEH